MFKLSTRSLTRIPSSHAFIRAPPASALRLRQDLCRVSHKIELKPRAPQQLHRLHLRGSISTTGLSFALLAAGFLIIYTFAAPSPQQQELRRQSPAFAMETPQLPPGHVGNLTPEQEAKLKQFWKAIFQVSGLIQDGSATDAADSKAAHHDDKFGLAQQFKQILKNTSPDRIREMVWNMTKCDHPDTLALRFLRARKWDVDKALIMLVSALNWRENEMGVDSDIMKNGEGGAALEEKSSDGKSKNVGKDFMTQLRMGKSYLHGTDREGRPICVVRVRLHRNGEQSNESIERYTVHIIETARLVLGKNVETATIVFDMTSFSLANMDYAPVKFMIKCFEANYPESLGAVLIHNSPWIFHGIWRIIRGWLDPVVAGKVHFTSGRAGLEEFIEPSKLPKELGGDEEWEYKYLEPVEGENEQMNDEKAKTDLHSVRSALVKDMESATLAWLGDDETKVADAKLKREELAGLLKANYWKLDGYVRARSLYDRQGVIGEGGSVRWYP